MTNLLQIAREQRARVQEEAERLDAFIQYGEHFERSHHEGAPGLAELMRSMKRLRADSGRRQDSNVVWLDVVCRR